MAAAKWFVYSAARQVAKTLGEPHPGSPAALATASAGKVRPSDEALRTMSNKKTTVQDFERAGLSTPEAFEWFTYSKRKQQIKWCVHPTGMLTVLI